MRKFRFRSLLVLVAALSLVAAACGGGDDDTTDTADGGGGATTSGACADADTAAGDLLAQVCTDGVDHGLDRPGLSAAVVSEPRDR